MVLSRVANVAKPAASAQPGKSEDGNLTDVQAAFSSLTWSAPTPNSSDAEIQLASPNGVGFDFPSQTAELFSFSTADVGVASTPEPSATGLLLLSAGMAMVAIRFRQSPPWR